MIDSVRKYSIELQKQIELDRKSEKKKFLNLKRQTDQYEKTMSNLVSLIWNSSTFARQRVKSRQYLASAPFSSSNFLGRILSMAIDSVRKYSIELQKQIELDRKSEKKKFLNLKRQTDQYEKTIILHQQ
jgi:hypothetical protein